MNELKSNKEKIIKKLISGGIVFMPTNTIPGLICLTSNISAVNRLYELKKRNKSKPPTIIISKVHQLISLGIEVPSEGVISKYWPGKTSLVLEIKEDHIEELYYLHRSQNSLAIRLAEESILTEIIDEVGPLATSSANFEGEKPALDAYQARLYFGDSVELYVDCDDMYKNNQASTILKVNKDGSVIKIR